MQNNIFVDIWNSLRATPLWVQLWMIFILMPINIIGLFLLDQPMAPWIAGLALFGMLPNIVIMYMERGMSKLMAIPHLLPWTVLIAIILFARPEGGSNVYEIYLNALLVINVISLLFDYPDAIKWFKGDRAIAGKEV